MSELHASEQRTIGQVLELLPRYEDTMNQLLDEVSPHCRRVKPGARILELGAAQGLYLLALCRAGYEASGIEPWEPAVEVSRELAKVTGVEIDVHTGWAEDLPFPDGEFDLVLAVSVMEHVRDPQAVFEEAHRVLRPDGGFYFFTTNALAPHQHEIKGFPLFPWYPAALKRRIMRWAAERHPSLVGGTATPAINWFTPWGARRDLRTAGFTELIEWWQLKREDRLRGWRRAALRTVRRVTPARLAAEFVRTGTAFLAIK